ncbi:uncharacterized protein E5676_scaffold610G00440 [Cucumis melo var. makuwa]|uniref:Uncharacterized protein n=1 Tax=Cucumis melo var. makuwa TaxID=1194695 RepID=A0A5D3DKE6_CUCMM|nr:uncharacterized protein E6C27_scaffold174G00490 [Cucumis melo var. makuwa]TYK24141.1 uncharacterized protein E5676_scaffold610G00440 [Cucumis melo var. makuwa]
MEAMFLDLILKDSKLKIQTDNIHESIAMLTKQLFKVVEKFRNTNNYGSNSRDQNSFKRRESDNPSGKDVKALKWREGGGYAYFSKETEKKKFSVILSHEKSHDSDGEGEYTNAFVSISSKDDSVSWVEDSISHKENTLSYDQCEEDSSARAAQK